MPEPETRAAPLVLAGMLPPPVTGQSLGFELILRSLRQRGIPARVVNLTGSGRASGVARALEYVGILADYARRVAGPPGTVYLMISQTRKGFLRDVPMVWLARLFRHRMVCQLRGGNYDGFYAAQPALLRWLVRRTLRQVDAILVLGELLRAEFDFEPRLRERIHVVPNGLPDERGAEPAPKRLPAPGGGPIRLLYLSNLVESKGWIDVLEAVDRLARRHGLDVECHLHGEFLAHPPDDVRVESAEQARELFEKLVAERGLAGRVRYGGLVSGEAKLRALREAHVFLLPTSYLYEGQPVSIVEALAWGCPVVSTRFRAIPELVVDGVTGRLVPYGDPDALARAVADIVSDPDAYTQMSRSALAHFAGHFTAERHIDRLLGFLRPGAPDRDA